MSDLISRQAAIDEIKALYEWHEIVTEDRAIDHFKRLPSAEPERKKGKWKKSYADHESFGVRPFFRYCSECHESTVYAYNYCPNCGADMRKKEMSE